jgi:protein ImuA
MVRQEREAMPTQPMERHALIAQLREEIRRIERRPARRGGVVPCGLAEMDAALPGGGFPRGALSELVGGPASGKTAVALALLSALGQEDLSAWVDARGELYPPAGAALGVDLARLLIVRPAAEEGAGAEPPRTALWAAEALLGAGAFAAVVVDIPLRGPARGWDGIARRLQSAVEKGGAVGLWLSAPGGAARVPAAVRIELGGASKSVPFDLRSSTLRLRSDHAA